MGGPAHPGSSGFSAPPLLWRYRTERRCPQCGSHDVARSRRRSFLVEPLLLFFFRLRPYRCRQCTRRYFGYAGALRAPADYEHQSAA